MAKIVHLFLLLLMCGFGSHGIAVPNDVGTAKAKECLRKSFEAARGIEEQVIRRQLLEEVGQDLACGGDVATARQVVAEIRDAKGAGMILAAIGMFQAKHGEGDAAKTTLADALKRIGEVPRDDRRFVLCDILSAHLAAGQFAEARQVASRFEDESGRLFAKTDIVKAYLVAGRREEAETLLNEISLRYIESWPSRDRFQQFNAGSVLAIHLELDDVAGAIRLASAIPRENNLYCNALCAVGEYQAKSGKTEAAAATLKVAIDAAQRTAPNGDGMSVESAHELAITAVVRAHVGGGDLEGAVKTLQLMPDCYQKAEASEAVAAAQAKAGKRAAARATLEQAIGMAERALVDDQGLLAQALASLAKREIEIGEKTGAADTLAKALKAVRQTDAYNVEIPSAVVAALQVRLGDPSAARRTLEEAARKVRTISDAADRAYEASRIAAAQIALGFNDAALAMVREIAQPLIPLPDPQMDGREEAAALLSRAGDLAGGYRVAREIGKGTDFRASAVRAVAAYHVMAKGSDEALALAAKETDPVLRSSLYHGIALTLLKSAGIEAPTFWRIDPDGNVSALWSPAKD